MTTTCSECGATKPDGMSEEERGSWEAYKAGYSDRPTARAFPTDDDTPMGRLFALRFWQSARAPLEAKVRELDAQVDQFRDALHTLERDKDRRISELEAQCSKLDKRCSELWDWKNDLEAQLAQAQKPDEAKGLPTGHHGSPGQGLR